MNIDPRGLSVTDWCDAMVLQLDPYGTTPRLDDSSEWQDWASEVVQFSGIDKQSPPDPFDFTNWGEWAMRFNQAVTL